MRNFVSDDGPVRQAMAAPVYATSRFQEAAKTEGALSIPPWCKSFVKVYHGVPGLLIDVVLSTSEHFFQSNRFSSDPLPEPTPRRNAVRKDIEIT